MKKISILLAALFLIVGMAHAQDVYFAGNGNGIGKIWKNDTLVYSISDTTHQVTLSSMQMASDSSIYTAGYLHDTAFDFLQGRVWLNDNAVFVADTNTAISGLVLHNGTWTAAGVGKNEWEGTDGLVWQNGELINSFSDSTLSNQINAVVFDTITGDIYAGGIISDSVSRAAIWKNDTLLWREDLVSVINAIAFDGINLYAVGTRYIDETPIATIWQNGAIIHSIDSPDAELSAITCYNGSVYYAAYHSYNLFVWKDGVILHSHPCIGYSSISVLTVNEGGVFYAGQFNGTPTVWKDGHVLYQPEDCDAIVGIGVILPPPLPPVPIYTLTVEADTTGWGTVTGSGIYTEGDTVTIQAFPNVGCEFLYWNDSITDNPRDIVITQDSVFTAYFGRLEYNVATLADPEEGGTVNGGGLYHYGDTITLEAVANDFYVFERWNDSIVDNPRSVVVTQDSLFTAFFTHFDVDYTIETIVDPENAGTILGGGEYHAGDTVTLTAIPNDGFAFERWNDDVTDNPRSIVVTQDSLFTAFFTHFVDYTIETLVDPENAGTILGGGDYHTGDTVTLTAIPNDGFAFERWNDDVTDNPRDIVVTQDSTFTAYFSRVQYTIEAVSDHPAWGYVTGGGAYYYGDTIQLTATPNLGFAFVCWSDSITSNPRTVVVTEDQTFTAIFEVRKCYIRTKVSPEEAGYVTGGGFYDYGEIVTLAAHGNTGYVFESWDDGNIINPRTVFVEGDATYTAVFSVSQYEITTECQPVEGGTVSGGGIYNYGDAVTLRARPYDNYSFVCWSDGITSNPRTIIVTHAATYKAIFSFNGTPEYTIKVVANDPDLGTVAGEGVYPEGSIIEISATPAPGATFTGWDDGNTDNPRTIVVTENRVFTAIFVLLPTYTIKVKSESPSMGTTYGSGTYLVNTVINIGATPNEGYYFTGWQDGDMNNPRTITVTEDAEYIASFSEIPAQTYTVTVYFDENQGFILGAGTYAAGSTASIAAIPADGYIFVKWNDGTTDNPKTVIVDHDIIMAAFFDGTGVDESDFETVSLYPNPANDIIRIDGLEGEHEIAIYNTLGALVKSAIVSGDSEIGINELSDGIYLVRIDNRHTMRFVKKQ